MADISLALGHNNSPSGSVVLKSIDCPGAPKVGSLLNEEELGKEPVAPAESQEKTKVKQQYDTEDWMTSPPF